MNIIEYRDQSQPILKRRPLSSSKIYTLFYKWTFVAGAYNGTFYIIEIPNKLAGLIPKCNRLVVKALYFGSSNNTFQTGSGERIAILQPSSINNINTINDGETYISTAQYINNNTANNNQKPQQYYLKNSKAIIPYDILLNNSISIILRFVNTAQTYAGRNSLAQICLNFQILD